MRREGCTRAAGMGAEASAPAAEKSVTCCACCVRSRGRAAPPHPRTLPSGVGLAQGLLPKVLTPHPPPPPGCSSAAAVTSVGLPRVGARGATPGNPCCRVAAATTTPAESVGGTCPGGAGLCRAAGTALAATHCSKLGRGAAHCCAVLPPCSAVPRCTPADQAAPACSAWSPEPPRGAVPAVAEAGMK